MGTERGQHTNNMVRGCFKFTFTAIFQGFRLLLIEYFPLVS